MMAEAEMKPNCRARNWGDMSAPCPEGLACGSFDSGLYTYSSPCVKCGHFADCHKSEVKA